MAIDNTILENIVINGGTDSSDIFDQISDNEEKMEENKDLYDAFYVIKKILDSPSRYNEIQTVAPSIDVNNGTINIKGVCKHTSKVDRKDLGVSADKHVDSTYTGDVVELYASELSESIPDNLSLEYEILNDTMARMDKTSFVIIIKRK